MLLEEIFQTESLQNTSDVKKASKEKIQTHNAEVLLEFNA